MLSVYGDTPGKLILPQDVGREKPRTLLVKCMSKVEARAWQRKVGEVRQIDDLEKRDAAYDELLASAVVGWENIEGAFAVAAIGQHFSLGEYAAIFDLVPFATLPTIDDRKK